MKLNLLAATAVLAASTLLVGCSKDNPAALLEAAKGHLAKNENRAAVIQVKNALQANPDLPEARYLLGVALLADGDPVGAELELRKALALKHPADAVAPKLASAMLAQGQAKKLVEEFAATRLGSATANAELQTSLAAAQGMEGNAAAAASALDAALAADPAFVPALLLRARQKAGSGDTDGALAAAEDILKRDPANVEAWKFKGDLLQFSKAQPEQALAAYNKAIELKPENLAAHLAVVSMLVRQGKVDEAHKQLETVKKFAANQPQAMYLEALIAFQRKDFKLARDIAQQLLKVLPNDPALLFLAGNIELQNNSLALAEAHLARTVQLAPQAVQARRLLVTTYLRSNQPDKAIATLRAGQGKDEVAPELYFVAGEAYLQKGDVKLAEQYFAKASKLDPGDARKRTALAVTHLASGQASAAIDELQGIAQSDTGVSADLALVSTHLRRKEFDKALKAIDAVERKLPDKPLAASLRGRTQLQMGNVDGARKSFERALALAPNDFPVVASLAAIDVNAKKPEEARKRIDAFLVNNPKSGPALLALAELAAATGAGKDEVAAQVAKAVAANPGDSAARVALVNVYLRNKDPKQAMTAAQDAAAALPDNPDVLDALGRVQQEAGEFNQAIATYNKLSALQPSSAGPHMRLANVQMAAKNKEAAAQSLRKALELQPNLVEAQRGLAMLDASSSDFKSALAMAKTVQTQRPTEAAGFALEGDINVGKRDWPAAVAAYRAGLKQAPSTELAVKLHSALQATDKLAEAQQFAAGWRKDHPEDVAFMFHLADIALIRKDFAGAEALYLAMLKLQPNNAAVLNNLAWVTDQLKKEGALAYAEKANQLQPDQPAFMDTLASILARAGQFDKSIALQKKAVELQPANQRLKLNLAKVYVQAGDKAGARRELDQLAALGDKFPAQAEVASLLKSL